MVFCHWKSQSKGRRNGNLSLNEPKLTKVCSAVYCVLLLVACIVASHIYIFLLVLSCLVCNCC